MAFHGSKELRRIRFSLTRLTKFAKREPAKREPANLYEGKSTTTARALQAGSVWGS